MAQNVKINQNSRIPDLNFCSIESSYNRIMIRRYLCYTNVAVLKKYFHTKYIRFLIIFSHHQTYISFSQTESINNIVHFSNFIPEKKSSLVYVSLYELLMIYFELKFQYHYQRGCL